MFDIRPVLFINGVLLLILAAAMAVPLMVGAFNAEPAWQSFAVALLVTSFVGGALIFAHRSADGPLLKTREAFFLAASAFPLLAFFAALPLYWGGMGFSPVDSLFEAISGLTTTGATVMQGLDGAPSAILLWRAVLQWLGGAGVIVAAVALLPMLRIGGMQHFQLKSSDYKARMSRRLPSVAKRILLLYAALTGGVALALGFAGMTALEAVCHAMACLSTGGFSTSDQSLAHFGDGARWICVGGMLLGGATLLSGTRSGLGVRGRLRDDGQLLWYVRLASGFSLALAFWNWAVNDMAVYEALRQATFNAVAILSTTGFHTADYSQWGGFAQVAFFVMSLIGGCTGSTAGGVKIFRYQVLFAISGVHIRRLVHPNGVFPLSFKGLPLSEGVTRSVLGFVMLYFCCFAGLALALTVIGLDPLSSISGAAAALGNVGPALGSVIGPAGSYHDLPAVAKVLLAGGMVLGRLELAPLLIVFSRVFWRD